MKQKTNEYFPEADEDILAQIAKYEKQLEEQRYLQKQFDFPIPTYLLSELKNPNENLFCLINLAKLNHRISNQNAEKLIRKLQNKEIF